MGAIARHHTWIRLLGSLFWLIGAPAGTLGHGFEPPVQGPMQCTCGNNGRVFEVGMVGYGKNSDRQRIIKVETNEGSSGGACRAIWISRTEIHPRGDPYKFHLERLTLKDLQLNPCLDGLDKFVKREKSYEFVLNADSYSIRDMRGATRRRKDTQPGVSGQASQSNSNLWDAITPESDAGGRNFRAGSSPHDSTREYNRTSWVFTRRNVKAHEVGILRDPARGERVVGLRKTHTVHAGHLGQVEAAGESSALVRFYWGGVIDRFGGVIDFFRHWADNTGGPYIEKEDGFFARMRADVLEVSLDDVLEVNDYLDMARTERTGKDPR